MSAVESGAGEWTERQRDVLDAALRLIVEGRPLTMTSLASAASCSKETIYKWFGDRAGLLTATVRHQASRVRGTPLPEGRATRDALEASLHRFAVEWLTVLGGQTSVALNRLAVAHAGTDRAADLGAIVLNNGPLAMEARLVPMLEAGRVAGILDFDAGDADTAARSFFGLVVRDVQIRLLLGDPLSLSPTEIERDAGRATRQFFTLFAAGQDRPAGGDS
ncbi:TetR/AcrR family transcriptional regulator C-terminal domain-containing protein [Antarcticirhabdus aurantiaca]|uniref:TetR/AcrR family transcriptional regulator C-terminal domain-containing protein n=1 Tax=Antarcticirhabdus aurantiaca TaxID=2606717 RepID=A0ACD4NI61_9HYPH|nr:TetR/AcrR family transcriptional regulator C-terminal domain-containing protein [Antarcticirhabdus aurantiaca]WAJ26479.1 TetR/AcrR family transcriptional regulator C-terminal domain-containing protein [Jeongeuplla avenae]